MFVFKEKEKLEYLERHIQLFHYQHTKIADTLEYMHSDKIHLQIYHQLLD